MSTSLLRKDQDASNHDADENSRGKETTDRKAALVDRLIKQITERGAKRSREDEGAPEK
jgi:hypothetical protein